MSATPLPNSHPTHLDGAATPLRLAAMRAYEPYLFFAGAIAFVVIAALLILDQSGL